MMVAVIVKAAAEAGDALKMTGQHITLALLSTCPRTKPCFVEWALLPVHGKETGRSARLTVLFLDRSLGIVPK